MIWAVKLYYGARIARIRLRIVGIRIRYVYRLIKIKLRLWKDLLAIKIAGWLVRLAFWLSPALKKQMGYK